MGKQFDEQTQDFQEWFEDAKGEIHDDDASAYIKMVRGIALLGHVLKTQIALTERQNELLERILGAVETGKPAPKDDESIPRDSPSGPERRHNVDDEGY